jgi:hypothetical protein
LNFLNKVLYFVLGFLYSEEDGENKMPVDSLILTIIAITVIFTGLVMTGYRILKRELKKELIEELKNAR